MVVNNSYSDHKSEDAVSYARRRGQPEVDGCVTIQKCLFVSSLIVCTSARVHPKRRERPETGRMVKR